MTKVEHGGGRGGTFVYRGYICEECSENIEDSDDLLLMRPSYALPEEATLHYIHRKCRNAFLNRKEGRWDDFRYKSRDASWLVPVNL